jgi:pSer/pThr/pTyr-binding forkhead associated (FHA) protein
MLVVHEGTPQEQSLPLEGGSFTVGRGRNNNFQIKDDSKVSRRHTTFLDQEGVFLIRDGVEKASGGWKTSANGTQVNGELVTEATLVGGEEITIGETHFRFRVLS